MYKIYGDCATEFVFIVGLAFMVPWVSGSNCCSGRYGVG